MDFDFISLDSWILIVGGETYNNGMETLNSVELFNVKKNQSYVFGMLDIAVKHHVGVNFNGTPMYCGGISPLESPEKSCYKYDQSWIKVRLYYFVLLLQLTYHT